MYNFFLIYKHKHKYNYIYVCVYYNPSNSLTKQSCDERAPVNFVIS